MRPAWALGFGVCGLLIAGAGACGENGVAITLPEDSGTPDSVAPEAAPPDAGPVDAGKDAAPTDASGFQWPDCNTQPQSAATRTIPDVWTDDPSKLTEVWISGVYVTAISKGGCVAGTECLLYLQQDLTYATLKDGAQHGIQVFVSKNTAKYFTSVAVDDQVDVLAWAQRNTQGGQNELMLFVNEVNPGCMKTTGSGTATPITGVQLSDLTVGAYEDTIGPLLVTVDSVTGTPKSPGQIFGLGNTFYDGGGSNNIVSLSPYFLPSGVFTGLTQGQKTKFTSVTGVFGLFVPPTDGSVTKYAVIYPRDMSEVAQ